MVWLKLDQMQKIIIAVFLGLLILASCTTSDMPGSVKIKYDGEVPQALFAITNISKACKSKKIKVIDQDADKEPALMINMIIDPALGFEAYRIDQQENSIVLAGGDANGLMYAGIDLTEMILLGKDLQSIGSIVQKPYIRHRGLRYNIPLDARTPSYDDTGDAAQKNIETMWEWDFWKQYLDHMALNRYNLLTIWSLHPYPSWIRVPEYPEVALANVTVYNKPINNWTDMKWKDEGIQEPENLTVIREMSVEEKTEHWKKVFQYAEDRGIDIYLFHWNVFVNGAEGKHGIRWQQDHPITVDYIRKSIKQTLLTFPNIKGIGVTAGEHINRELTGKYKTENWMWHTYGQGIMDARAENPDLDVRFIFRRHWSHLEDIAEAFKDYPSEIETSFKYSRAHMYSSTKPPWFDKIYREIVEDHDIPCWLNVRNDDIFTFRWGDPEYASEYIKNVPYDLTPGFYMGPDGYVWGREFISKKPQSPRQLAVDKHWYRFRIWGRTAYNPNLESDYWSDQISLRFPEVDAEHLYHTWKASSDIISLVDKIHFRQNDYQFSPEGCFDRGKFHDVDFFIAVASMPLQGVISISDYAKDPENLDGMTPFDIATQLDAAAKTLIEGAVAVDPGNNVELSETLGDMTALGYLGHYYAQKVRGATHLAMYRWSGKEDDKTHAVAQLQKAIGYWEQYAETANAQYHPQLYARTQELNWDALLEFVKKDVDIARTAEQGESIDILHDNILWKRDTRRF